jgi:hypothetical protein
MAAAGKSGQEKLRTGMMPNDQLPMTGCPSGSDRHFKIGH